MLHVGNIKRRRHGKYENPEFSRRQSTISYTLPLDGDFIQVCKSTFMNTFSVSKKRLEVIIRKKKMGDTFYKDRRTNNKKLKFGEVDREQVRQHIMSIPREVSHYNRTKSAKEYISPDLNIHRLYRAFLEKFPSSAVTYKYYRSVFIKDFPNLSFHRPRVDTCRTCDKLQCEIAANNATAKTQLEVHHRKVEHALLSMKNDFLNSPLPNSSICCLSMDLQQVMFVPSLTHSDMFYLRQLSCYNFNVHLGDTNRSFMCMWNEGVGGRGANEIASCLLRVLNNNVTNKNHLVIWSDNCVGQNKNKMILFVLIFLVVHGVYDVVEHKFLISGHSFMASDRDFALIEKRKRVMKSFVPKDLHEVVTSARYSPPFEVIDMELHGFWDIKRLAEEFLNTTKVNITKSVWIRIEKECPFKIKIKQTYGDIENWQTYNVLKKGKTLSDLKKAELLKLPPENKITDVKKQSLRSMIPFLKDESHKSYYTRLLNN